MLIKKVVTLASQTNPDIGMFALMFSNLPESYSIAASCTNRDKGVELNEIIMLDDLKQLIQMALIEMR